MRLQPEGPLATASLPPPPPPRRRNELPIALARADDPGNWQVTSASANTKPPKNAGMTPRGTRSMGSRSAKEDHCGEEDSKSERDKEKEDIFI